MCNPKARQENIVVQEVFDELVIYDLLRNQLHSLNSTAALVWQHCDGQTSPAQVAAHLRAEMEVPQAEELVWLALDRLEKAHLLEQKVVRPDGFKISRRQVLRALGVSAFLLPIIATIPAPAVAQTLTCPSTNVRTFDPYPASSCSTNLDDLCRTASACNNPLAFGLACDDSDVEPGTAIKLTCCCP